MFKKLYDWVMQGCRHRHAQWYLGGVAFAESSFFPIPPDVMLAPMTLARPDRSWHYAGLTTISSVLGGVLGYYIGVYLLDVALPLIERIGYMHHYDTTVRWFSEYGFWAIFVAGFTPIPYKVFTISAGAAAMPLLPFVAGSMVGRGLRYFLIAALVRWAGPKIEPQLVRYIDAIGWLCLLLIVAVVVWLQLR